MIRRFVLLFFLGIAVWAFFSWLAAWSANAVRPRADLERELAPGLQAEGTLLVRGVSKQEEIKLIPLFRR